MDEWTLGRRAMGARTFGRMVKNMIPTCHDATMMTTSPPVTTDAFNRLPPTSTTTYASGVEPKRALYPTLPADTSRIQQVSVHARARTQCLCVQQAGGRKPSAPDVAHYAVSSSQKGGLAGAASGANARAPVATARSPGVPIMPSGGHTSKPTNSGNNDWHRASTPPVMMTGASWLRICVRARTLVRLQLRSSQAAAWAHRNCRRMHSV